MDIKIYNNKMNFKLNQLIEIGKRSNNAKRNFLFISKLLGKHIEVRPDMCKAAGHLLASLKYPELRSEKIIDYVKGENVDIKYELNKTVTQASKILVIGFAETATGLGMAVASKIKDCIYQTTTREPITDVKNLLSFEEEHSHATTHKFYSLLDYDLNDFDEIILVDDEITTGNSMLNLITELINICSVRKYSILSILDWRDDTFVEKYKDFATTNNVSINVYSLLSGQISIDNFDVYTDNSEPIEITQKTSNIIDMIDEFNKVELNTQFGKQQYLKNTGRFGVKQNHIENIEMHAKNLANKINDVIDSNEKILVIGHGENIYIPSRIASYINANVMFKTTTRSPIFCDGNIIKTKYKFIDRGVTYFLYNKEDIETQYDKIIFLAETPLDLKLCDNIMIFNI